MNRQPWWVLLSWAILIPCLYLPTLSARFDFMDDGCLVYPAPGLSTVQKVERIWERTVSDFEMNGPFRPVTWAFWETAADLFGPNAWAHRSARLVWAMISCFALLWLLRELRICGWPLFFTAAHALWNPYRNEIWMTLGLTEAFAMPFALLGLVAAIRAAQSERSGLWDVLGITCVLLAIGCKNTFAALVPAQIVLRVWGGGLSFQEGWRRHGRRACLLACTLVFPVGHFIAYKVNYHAGQYATVFSWAQVGRMLRTVLGAMSVDFLGPCLAVVLGLCWLNRRRQHRADEVSTAITSPVFAPAVYAGLALVVFGIGIYAPVSGTSGRYAMPAVWGADICLGILLMILLDPSARWRFSMSGLRLRNAARICLGCGLAIVAALNVGKQTRYAARADALWQALEFIEEQAPAHASILWVGDPKANYQRAPLATGEGVHFGWHLEHRGRQDFVVTPIDFQQIPPPPRSEAEPATFLISGTAEEAQAAGWQPLKDFQARFWLGWRRYHCYVWTAEK